MEFEKSKKSIDQKGELIARAPDGQLFKAVIGSTVKVVGQITSEENIQIDGNGITERYLGGFGAPTGTANAWDVYTFTLIKDDGGGWNAYISYNYYTT